MTTLRVAAGAARATMVCAGAELRGVEERRASLIRLMLPRPRSRRRFASARISLRLLAFLFPPPRASRELSDRSPDV